MRARVRRLVMGLSTVLGLGRRGFFIPCRTAGAVAPPGRRPPYDALESIFRARAEDFLDHLDAMVGYAVELERIGTGPPPAPRWDQGWFPRLDGAAAFAMVRRRQPVRIVEVGSGHSTRILVRAVDDGGLDTIVTAIDPAPRAELAGLGVETIASTLQKVGPKPFERLAPGDVLSIDSSHVLMPGSDVDILFNMILPSLPPGVLVHVHDVFLPDDYPRRWAWRAYNEQLAVAALLQGRAYDILWSSRYVASRLAEALSGTVLERLAIPPGAHESSLWLLKTGKQYPQ